MSYQVGDKVEFTDEFGKKRQSVITRIVPKGEYAKDEIAYAIKGTYGSYFRTADEIKRTARTALPAAALRCSLCQQERGDRYQ